LKDCGWPQSFFVYTTRKVQEACFLAFDDRDTIPKQAKRFRWLWEKYLYL